MKSFRVILLLLMPVLSVAQDIEGAEPPFWWIQMQNTELQIMLYGDDIGLLKPDIHYDGLRISKVVSTENLNYLFLYVNIGPLTRAGSFPIDLKDENGKIRCSYSYELLKRDEGAGQQYAFDNSDVLYLVTPDRFVNGNTENDVVEGMLELPDRTNKWGRHGGDIQGILQSLDYLIQNTIWWIEYLQLSGIRMDTYPYSDKEFMRDWTCAVMNEYPRFNICGEEWSLNPAVLAYWQAGKDNPDGYISCLPGLLDFPLQDALVKALTEEENWNAGMINLYEMLSNDFLYPDPFRHVVFPDNHDMSRIYTRLNEDYGLFRLAMVYFTTIRGTPQFYYGTEILMSNTGDNSHGNIRSDFPGGWPGDLVNAFTGEGLSDRQAEAQKFVRKLLGWRKTAVVVHQGKLKHFVPRNGVYVYFRYNGKQKVMVVLNKTGQKQQVDLSQFDEMHLEGKHGQEILTGTEIHFSGHLTVGSKQPMIIELN
jgi:glycosidase